LKTTATQLALLQAGRQRTDVRLSIKFCPTLTEPWALRGRGLTKMM
jgi:hypothetical protein